MRHYFAPSGDFVRRPKRKTRLKSLSVEEILLQLESVDYQLANPLFIPRNVKGALKKRKLDLEKALLDRVLDEKYAAELQALQNPNNEDFEIRDFRRNEENPPRKAQCRAPNRGFYRPKPPSPTGKTVGAFRVVRRQAIDHLIKRRKDES